MTSKSLSVIRLHGRNYEGWLGENVTDWRAERTLYDYSMEELEELKDLVTSSGKGSRRSLCHLQQQFRRSRGQERQITAVYARTRLYRPGPRNSTF
ncbi:MAG: hypothetical protein U5K84_12395 [Alkalibacterium sp.]|nr:hypothetical protein [Alkalibacterium sp.]